jgi:hypothetical protein
MSGDSVSVGEGGDSLFCISQFYFSLFVLFTHFFPLKKPFTGMLFTQWTPYPVDLSDSIPKR